MTLLLPAALVDPKLPELMVMLLLVNAYPVQMIPLLLLSCQDDKEAFVLVHMVVDQAILESDEVMNSALIFFLQVKKCGVVMVAE